MRSVSKENKRFGGIEFLLTGANCILFAYIVMYFSHIGYSESTIGIVMAITNIATIVAQPLFGYLSDYKVTIKKIVLINIFISVFISSAIPFVKDYFLWMFIVFVLISFTERPLLSVLDSYILKLSEKRSGLDYGFVRGFGSIGYALAAIACGKLIDKFGFNSMFGLHSLVLILALFLGYTLEDYPINKRGQNNDNKVSFFSAIKILLRNRKYAMLTFSSFIAFIGIGGTGTYLSILIKHSGGTNVHLGWAIFAMCVSEAIIMWNYFLIIRKIKIEKLILFSLIMYIFKIYLVTVFTSPIGIIAVQPLQALTYGLFLPSVLRYICELVPEELRSTAITFSVSVYGGLGGVIGTLCGGFIIENYDVYTFFKIATICCVIAVIIYIWGVLYEKPIKNKVWHPSSKES